MGIFVSCPNDLTKYMFQSGKGFCRGPLLTARCKRRTQQQLANISDFGFGFSCLAIANTSSKSQVLNI